MPTHQEARSKAKESSTTSRPFFSKDASAGAPKTFFTSDAVQRQTEGAEVAEPTAAPQHAEVEAEKEEIDPASPIRLEVFKLFEVLKNQGVLAKPGSPLGSEDADWKEITGYTQEAWNNRKALEAPWDAWREYNEQLKYIDMWNKAEAFAKANKKKNPLKEIPEPKPVKKPDGDPITKLTTCILVQTKILARAAQNLNLKYDTAHLMDPKMMETSPAWNWASPHMGERPTQGDIFVLISLGDKLKKAKDSLSRAQNQSPKQLQRLKDASEKTDAVVRGWQDKIFAESNNIDVLEVKIAIVEQDKLRNKGLLKQAKDMRKQYTGAMNQAMKQAKEARKAMEDAFTAKERAQKMLEEARTGEQFRTQLFFSHVGFFVSKEPMPGDPTKELWKTFDGGQTFTEGKTTKQGAKYVDRVYDPTTNEIWAKPHQAGQIESQDGQTRWFLGWYNLDKLVRAKEEKPKAK